MEKLIPYNNVHGRNLPNPCSIIKLALSDFPSIEANSKQVAERICMYLYNIMITNDVVINASAGKGLLSFAEGNK